MAASVSYRINGKYDGKAVSQAKNGMSALASSAKVLKNALSFVGVTASVTALTRSLKESGKVFKENNSVQTAMFKAMSNNAKNAQTDIKKLVKEFDSMNGFFTGSEIVKGGGILAQMGLGEEQMRSTIQVAKDMAASGIMPLEQASKELGKTFNGNITALSKMFPELKNLTKEELANGKAVEILGQKYAGMEKSMSNTFDGMDRKFSNSLDGVKDAVGAIVSALSFQGKAGMVQSLNDIAKWFNDNRNEIINFFLHLPEVGLLSVQTLVKGIKTALSPKAIKDWLFTVVDYFKLVLQAMWDSYIAVCKVIASPMISAFEFLRDKITGIWDGILTTVKNLFAKAVNGIFDKLPKVVRDWLSGKGFEKITVETPTEKNNKTYADYFKNNWAEVQKAFDQIGKDFNKNADALKKSATTFAENFTGTKEEFLEGLKNILGQDLPEGIVNAFNYGGSGNVTGNTYSDGSNESTKNPWSNVWSNLGDIGTIITSALEGSWIGVILKMISSAISVIGEKTTVLTELFSVFDTIFRSLFTPEFINMLNQFFGPVLSAITSIFDGLGYIISILSEVFTPILNGVGKCIEIISKVIQSVLAVCYNIYVACWNFFHSKKNEKEYKSLSDIWSSVSTTDYSNYSAGMYSAGTTTSSGSSNSASYTAARDVIVNISFNNSYVNGDARQIAVNLWNEIKAAERMGYIS